MKNSYRNVLDKMKKYESQDQLYFPFYQKLENISLKKKIQKNINKRR